MVSAPELRTEILQKIDGKPGLSPEHRAWLREVADDPTLLAGAAQWLTDVRAGKIKPPPGKMGFENWKREIMNRVAAHRPLGVMVQPPPTDLPRRHEGAANAARGLSDAAPPPRETGQATDSAAPSESRRKPVAKSTVDNRPIMEGIGPDVWPADGPVKMDGINGKLYFVRNWLGQSVSFSEKEISERFLIMLTGDVSYPAKLWPARPSHSENFNVKAAGDALQKSLALVGFYDPAREKGPGASLGANGELVWHAGDMVFKALGEHEPGNFGGVVYRRASPILRPSRVASDKAGRSLFEIIGNWQLRRGELDTQLCGGGIGAGMIGGALNVRPNLYYIGPPGVGKSSLLECQCNLLGGRNSVIFATDASEAGLRNAQDGGTVSTIVDENEKGGDPVANEKLTKLIRSFATGGTYRRSTSSGVALTYEIRSALTAASVLPPDFGEAEESRTIFLQLEKPAARTLILPPPEQLHRLAADLLRLWFDRWPSWPAIFAAFRDGLQRNGFSNRRADIFGTALAAAHLLQRGDVPDARTVQSIFRALQIGQLRQAAEIIHDAESALDFLRSLSLPVGPGAVYEPLPLLVARAGRSPDDYEPASDDKEQRRYRREIEEAGAVLVAHGMKLLPPSHLFIVSNHPAFQRLLERTPFGGQIGRHWRFGEVLERCDGVKRNDQCWFSDRPRRGVRVPLSLLPPDLPTAAPPPLPVPPPSAAAPCTPGAAMSLNLQQSHNLTDRHGQEAT